MYVKLIQYHFWKMELKTCKFESISKVNFDTIIDVRSPKEFTEDHIPNSINLPVLSDFEREVVGKIYIYKTANLKQKNWSKIYFRKYI